MRRHRPHTKGQRALVHPRAALACALLVGGAGGVGAQSRIPQSALNYLQTAYPLDLGDRDRINVIFFEVPDTVTNTLYFAINDPANDAVSPDQLAVATTTDYYLVGGTGTISDANSRLIDYTGIEVQARTGTVLDTRTFVGVDGGWEYFQGVSPSQGERIGSKYHFKAVVEMQAAGSGKNAYQMDVSFANSGAPAGVSGVRTFSYSWNVALLDTQTWNMYPFVPDSAAGNIEMHNFDMDGAESGNAYDIADALQGAVTVSGNNVTATTPFAIGAQVNGTWRLEVIEAIGGPAENTSELWATNSVTADNYRVYSSFYVPPAPDRVVLVGEDGAAIADGADVEQVTLQIVAVDGTPLQYSRNIYVSVTGAATIVDSNNGPVGAGSTVVTTDVDGTGFVTVSDASVEMVTVSLLTDGTNGSDNFGAGVDDTYVIDFVTNPDPILSAASNQTFGVGDPPTGILTLDLTDSPVTANFTAGNDIRIRIPGTLTAGYDTSVTNPVLGGTGAGNITLTVTYPRATEMVLDVTTTFAPGDTLTVAGLALMTFVSESSGSLGLSYDGGTLYPVVDDKVFSIVDGNPPAIVARDTADLDGDGWIDALHLLFSKAIDDATVVTTDFTVAGAGALGFSSTTAGDTATDADIYLTFADGALATDATPAVTYTAGSLLDLSGLPQGSSSPIAATDAAGPAIWTATASDEVVVGVGIDADDTVTLVFSEATNQPPIAAATIDAVATLSSAHVWVDGAGGIGGAAWTAPDTLVVTLSVAVSPPTVAVGDTITLDGTTITDGTNGSSSAPSPAIAGLFWSGIATRVMQDSDANGHVDRVEITAIGPLNDDFSALTMSVGGFGTFSSASDYTTGTPADAVFYLQLPEGATLDTDVRPAVQVIANASLQVSGETLGVEPAATIATDGAPPVVGYTLAAVGVSEVAVYFSEPMATGMTAGDFSYSGAGSPSALTPSTVEAGGWHEVVLTLSAPVDAAALVLPETVTVSAAPTDLVAQPVPVAERTFPVSEVLIGVAEPLWASDGVQGDGTSGTGPLREHDGSGTLLDRDTTVQVSVDPAASALSPVRLWYDADVAGGVWLPVPLPDLVVDSSPARVLSAVQSTGNLYDFLVPETDSELVAGVTAELVVQVGARYVLRLADPADIRSVVPWAYGICEVVEQRAGVTILQSVIDPTRGDRVTVTFELPRAGLVTVLITSLAGDVIDILLRGSQQAGRYDVSWDGRNRAGQVVGRGVYFVTVTAPELQESRKVLVVKE